MSPERSPPMVSRLNPFPKKIQSFTLNIAQRLGSFSRRHTQRRHEIPWQGAFTFFVKNLRMWISESSQVCQSDQRLCLHHESSTSKKINNGSVDSIRSLCVIDKSNSSYRVMFIRRSRIVRYDSGASRVTCSSISFTSLIQSCFQEMSRSLSRQIHQQARQWLYV